MDSPYPEPAGRELMICWEEIWSHWALLVLCSGSVGAACPFSWWNWLWPPWTRGFGPGNLHLVLLLLTHPHLAHQLLLYLMWELYLAVALYFRLLISECEKISSMRECGMKGNMKCISSVLAKVVFFIWSSMNQGDQNPAVKKKKQQPKTQWKINRNSSALFPTSLGWLGIKGIRGINGIASSSVSSAFC